MATLGDNSMIGATINSDAIVNESINTWSDNFVRQIIDFTQNLISTVDYTWAGTAAEIFKKKADSNFANNLVNKINESATSMVGSSTSTRQVFDKLNQNLEEEINSKLNIV